MLDEFSDTQLHNKLYVTMLFMNLQFEYVPSYKLSFVNCYSKMSTIYDTCVKLPFQVVNYSEIISSFYPRKNISNAQLVNKLLTGPLSTNK